MNILVCIKQVPDSATKIQIDEDGIHINDSDVTYILNPYDEFAVEEALRLKEANGGEVTVISLGPDRIVPAIRSALAMGADKAIHLKSDDAIDADPLTVARALADGIGGESYDVVLLGKQAIDDDNHQMAPMLAELLDMPSLTVVSTLEIRDGSVTAERDIEGGKEIIETSLPVVISAQKGLNEPRYAALKGIMQAKKKPVDTREVELPAPGLTVQAISIPTQKRLNKILGEGADAVPELLKLLREEAKVL